MGLTQTDLATIAGASKGAQINWEKGTNSPPATALAAYADAGVDALYVLTGRRTADRPDEEVRIDERLAAIRRDMLVTAWEPHFEGEDGDDAEARALQSLAGQLGGILAGRAGPLTKKQQDEADTLMMIVSDPVQLAGLRAADHVQRNARRRRLRDRIGLHTNLGDFHPTEAVIDTMTTLVIEHGAPLDLLLSLFYEIVVSSEDQERPGEPTEKAPA